MATAPETFKYDPLGRWIYKSSSSGTAVYAYDGYNMVEEANATGVVVARYEQTQNIDEPLAMGNAACRRNELLPYRRPRFGPFAEQHGGWRTRRFCVCGLRVNLMHSVSQVVTRHAALESDTETGLYYYRARYYDPSAGRFLSEDPIGFEGGGNFFAYVSNSPSYLDPWGLQQAGQGHTYGPITWYTNTKGLTPTELAALKAHEGRHRGDFWNGMVFYSSCEVLEARGWGAEILVYQNRIKELKDKKCLSDQEKKELQSLEMSLKEAIANSDPKSIVIRAYCTAPKK